MTHDEVIQAAVTALAANISESIPEQNYEHELVARVVLEAVGYDRLTQALYSILEMAERSDAHPDLEFAKVARDALELSDEA